MRSLTLLYRKKTKNEKVEKMKKTIILRIFVGILALCLCILALTIAYFFNTDIQTKEPRQVSADCEIHTYTYMERNVFTVTKKNAEEIRKAHGKAIGYSENACEKCASHKDDCVYVIEIDTEKSEPNNPYRTGKYWGIVKDFALFVDHPEYIITTKNGVSFCFMDKEVTHKLGFYV